MHLKKVRIFDKELNIDGAMINIINTQSVYITELMKYPRVVGNVKNNIQDFIKQKAPNR
tara:strand:+ start:480 stop:656 length:177 start_codon:yes stop_codon:yes gene_type:complete